MVSCTTKYRRKKDVLKLYQQCIKPHSLFSSTFKKNVKILFTTKNYVMLIKFFPLQIQLHLSCGCFVTRGLK